MDMEDYIIRFADYRDIPSIMRFIDSDWKKGHILAHDRELFEWQYVDRKKVNMVLGLNTKGEIQAVLGFITYGTDDNKDYCTSVWRAREGNSFLGIKLLLFLLKEEPHRVMFSNGINVKTSGGIYKRLGIHIGKLKQWYRLQQHKDYRIANIETREIPKIKLENKFDLYLVSSFDEFVSCVSPELFTRERIPFKGKEYINNRYFNHPSYKYEIYAVFDENQIAHSAIVFRLQRYNDTCVLRIVDFLGRLNDFYYLTQSIEDLAKFYNAEYIDIYEYGLDDSMLYDSGWLLVGSNENIIPNYFAPYVQSNIEINICMTDENIVLFKGDGDQDRPN